MERRSKSSATKSTKKRSTATARPTKKTTQKRTAKRPSGQQDIVPMRLRGNLLLQFRASSAEYGQALLTEEKARGLLGIEQLKPAHRPLIRAMRDHEAAKGTLIEKEREFAATQAQVAQRLGIQLSELEHYTFDTDSGAVTYSPPKESKDGSS